MRYVRAKREAVDGHTHSGIRTRSYGCRHQSHTTISYFWKHGSLEAFRTVALNSETSKLGRVSGRRYVRSVRSRHARSIRIELGSYELVDRGSLQHWMRCSSVAFHHRLSGWLPPEWTPTERGVRAAVSGSERNKKTPLWNIRTINKLGILKILEILGPVALCTGPRKYKHSRR